MLVLKICCSEWKNENRDKRELAACKELGADVIVLAKGVPGDYGRIDFVDDFEVRRYTTRPLDERVPSFVNRIISVFQWAKYARKLSADIISGHDLFALVIGYISNFLRKKKSILIYDSHEFELGRNAKRSHLFISLLKLVEGFLIKKSAFTIVVNQSISEAITKIYGLKNKPIVVRNIPHLWEADNIGVAVSKEDILKNFSQRVDYIAMFHGYLRENIGVEYIIESLPYFESLGLLIVGDVADEVYASNLKELAEKNGVSGRIAYFSSVKYEKLIPIISLADFEVIMIYPKYKSYYYALPNKLFESIQAETPVIVSELPEMKRIVVEYKVGLSCEPSTQGLVRAIEKMLSEKEQYLEYKRNLSLAKNELCWENEQQRLKEAYSLIMEDIS